MTTEVERSGYFFSTRDARMRPHFIVFALCFASLRTASRSAMSAGTVNRNRFGLSTYLERAAAPRTLFSYHDRNCLSVMCLFGPGLPSVIHNRARIRRYSAQVPYLI